MKPFISWAAYCDCGWSYPPINSKAVKADVEEQVKRHRPRCPKSTTGV